MALIAGVQYGTPITSTVYSGIPAGTILPCGHGVAITSISVANPTVITTTTNHGLTTGDTVLISGTSTTPSTLGTYTATVTGNTTFTIPVNVTVGGAAVGAVSKIPLRMLFCDGTAYSRTTYSALFAAIGTSFGAGDGSTTFNVPDLRGVFIRGTGVQTISSVTYTGSLGTKQTDQFTDHVHYFHRPGGGGEFVMPEGAYGNGTFYPSSTLGVNANATNYRAGSQTNPANLTVNYCIAY